MSTCKKKKHSLLREASQFRSNVSLILSTSLGRNVDNFAVAATLNGRFNIGRSIRAASLSFLLRPSSCQSKRRCFLLAIGNSNSVDDWLLTRTIHPSCQKHYKIDSFTNRFNNQLDDFRFLYTNQHRYIYFWGFLLRSSMWDHWEWEDYINFSLSNFTRVSQFI